MNCNAILIRIQFRCICLVRCCLAVNWPARYAIIIRSRVLFHLLRIALPNMLTHTNCESTRNRFGCRLFGSSAPSLFRTQFWSMAVDVINTRNGREINTISMCSCFDANAELFKHCLCHHISYWLDTGWRNGFSIAFAIPSKADVHL